MQKKDRGGKLVMRMMRMRMRIMVIAMTMTMMTMILKKMMTTMMTTTTMMIMRCPRRPHLEQESLLGQLAPEVCGLGDGDGDGDGDGKGFDVLLQSPVWQQAVPKRPLPRRS